jgi:hypothetical protein
MKIIFALIISLPLFSCGESFKKLETEKLNAELATRNDLKTPEEVIILFYNYPKSEPKPNLKISKKELEENLFEVTLIHDNQEDDSQKAEKIIMTLKKKGTKWFVKNIKHNWKCYSERGHTDWGIENCN